MVNAKLGWGAALVMALALAGCGGGGGGDATGPTPGSGTGSVATGGTLVTSVPAASYSVSLGADFFSFLNSARSGAGAGMVAQSTAIDTAAAAHAAYLTANGTGSTPHQEAPAKTNYYAATVGARLEKAGFNAGVFTEVIGGPGPSGTGSGCAMGLLNTVYHGAALLGPYTFVGFGQGLDGINWPLCSANLATAASESNVQVPASGAVVAYPHADQTDVPNVFYAGYESPRPPVSLFPNLTAGTPILVSLRNADYVNARAVDALNAVITKFELKDGDGNVVPSAILANSALSGSGVTLHADSALGDGFAVLVPLAPLNISATYAVSLVASVKTGGAVISKSWTFTTGSGS